jgi:F-type H+-transporting ATPase subunit b
MPQFDPSVWSPQVIWLAITFIALYLLMARVALPRVREVLEDREFRINDSLRKAEALRHDAEEAVAAYEKRMADARTKAQDLLAGVRETAAAEAAERHNALSVRLAKDLAEAEQRIARARDEAMAGIRDVASDVAETVVERLIGERPDRSVVASTVDRAMTEVRR